MAEYIEREAGAELIEKLRYYANTYVIGDNLGREIEGTGELLFEATEVIEKIIAADVAPVVRGRWVRHNVDGTDMFGEPIEIVFACNCSVCGLDGRSETPYCPNCGARMEGSESK
jgi:hypothetical protein